MSSITDGSNRFKVRLESYSHGTSTTPTSTVLFEVMPTITESVNVDYQALDPLHMPGSFYTYRGTKARTFELGEVKFVSRNSSEASANQAYVNILRGWTQPYFGMGANGGAGSGSSGSNNIPAPTQTGNVYKVQDKSGTAVNNAQLRPLSTDEIKGILNTRETNKNATSTIDGGRVKHYVTATDSKRTNTNPQEQAYLHSAAVQSEVTRVLDNLNTDQAKQLKLRNSGDSNIQAHSIIKIPGASASAVKTKANVAVDNNAQLKFLGAPPDVLYLTAYSDARDTGGKLDRPANIFRIPVVITALSINFPNDVDYIPTLDFQPFPIIMSVTISLVESHSPRELEKFDIFKYREGLLPGF